MVYLRTLRRFARVPKTRFRFLRAAHQRLPQPITAPVSAPDTTDPVRRGQYLVRMAVCEECHTPTDPQGAPIPGLEFGRRVSAARSRQEGHSCNITQDPSGIPYYDESLFTQAIRTGKVIARASTT